MKMTALDRAVKRVEFGEDCWDWSGAVDRHGYAKVADDKGSVRNAHRVIWEMVVGPIPDGLVLDHLCRNPLCTNPDHMEPVTQKENLRRGVGVGAVVAQLMRDKTHCPHGHPLDGKGSNGARYCKECKRQRIREYRAKKKQEK